MSDDREVTFIEAEGSSGFKWFLLGAALGAGLGLLLAPQSGERTRRDIGRKVKRLQRQAGEKLEEFADEVQDRGKRIRESADEFIEEVEDRGRRVKASAEDFVDDLADEVRDTRRRVKASAEDFVVDVADEVRDTRRRVERNASSARDELERRLADARARRRAAIDADDAAASAEADAADTE